MPSDQIGLSMRRLPFQLIAVAALAVALLALRDSDAFLRTDFWAEDGRAFFGGRNALGWASLLEPLILPQ
jgi:hypothetical protein